MRILIFILAFAATICRADTNILELTWIQPPSYQSTLYTSTNLADAWKPLSTNSPPFSTYSDKSFAFFYVVVSPTNNTIIRYTFAGSNNPFSISAPAGATFVETNLGSLWVKISDDSTNGWIEEIH
jgi:hypothetical protein